jgi:L-ascorbate metabolism protein UlaG (beta-lactamase superfamily)
METPMLNRLLIALSLLLAGLGPALGQSRPSECLAIAQGLARLQYASLKEDEARITYVRHSTFLIESPEGVRAATDFAGFANSVIPDAVTMNRAHGTHYTDYPDPAIKHVLKGWGGEDGKPAQVDVEVGDMRIRNVTTDIRTGGFGRVTDGNSIFIFEAAGLCIGHLGHLHHELSPEHIGWIGRLDVVMVPVDGGLTMPVENMMEVVKLIRARIILPMHYFTPGSLERFLGAARTAGFAVEHLKEPTMVVSAATLPNEPTFFVMPGY